MGTESQWLDGYSGQELSPHPESLSSTSHGGREAVGSSDLVGTVVSGAVQERHPINTCFDYKTSVNLSYAEKGEVSFKISGC